MATRSLLRAFAKVSLATAVVGGGAAGAVIASTDDPASTWKLCSAVPTRLFRDTVTAAEIVFDYEYSLWGLPEGSEERMKAKHEVHLRSARKLEELCFKNGGIYIKLGQHLSQLEYLVPEEYVNTMRESMLNKCPVSSYDQVSEVIKNELGGKPEELFKEFDPIPIASASLAQVHVAHTHDGQKVAVKVQHIHMTDTAAADHATVDLIVTTLHRLFPSFDYRWLVDEMAESLPKISEAFAEMMFKHGFVHCDPHHANVLIRPLPSQGRFFFGQRKPQLVLLDHGLYKELDLTTRYNYAALWKGLVFSDAKAIKEYCVKLGAGEDLYALFAAILTMRPWNKVIDPAVDHLVMKGNDSDRSELQMYASQYFNEISELLRRLPRVLLLMLKTNDCLRAVNSSLRQGSSLESFLIIGRVSSEAVIEAKRLQARSIFERMSLWFEEMLVEARLWGMQLALWLLHIRKALCN
uniref:ABC1 atypical kinase-like domain-containing protein n=1 Tax=Kalanchoe fedtschenkoi TaxID=63787 RepID=A0A7N0TGX6_KALFE